ncbi:hypothetical protein [Frankia sp. Cas4]|uniref:hypothetical protein n=1 Tax=Frankia sp. Cas4 TaxID=3073927 RepID=UPI002AD3987A|nr:hypothetical protein [Frankia sp. Cas4]
MKIHSEASPIPTLAECFARYLRDLANKNSVDALIAALDSNGLLLERDLMQTHRGSQAGWVPTPKSAGVWNGRRCWLGWYPPNLNEVSAGDLWFDPVEISLMIIIPRSPADLAELAALPPRFLARQTPFAGWIAIRQMAVWQAVGYSLLTGHDLRIDTEASSPAAAVAGVSPALAQDVSLFFGKGTCDPEYWEATHEAFSKNELADLWREDAPEHGGEENSGFWIVVERADAMAGLPWTQPADGFPYLDEPFPAPGVRFRTAVSTQIGIIDPDDDEPGMVIDRRPMASMWSR